jgi:predicted nucleotide-binding protein
MTIEDIKHKLGNADLVVENESRLPNDTGTQLRLKNGSIVNCFDNGNYNIQGTNRDVVASALETSMPLRAGTIPVTPANDKVFVVYGHDPSAKTELEAMLRRWGLDPIILDQLPSEGATLIEKLEKYYPNVGFVVVLATPDDEAFPKGKPDEKKYRARQNVVLELGLMLAHLGRSKVAILLKDQDVMERPSDIHGLIYIPFKTDLAKEAGLLLAKEMSAQGYNIDVKKI